MTRRARSASGGISEAAFQTQVEALLRFYGWLFYHPPDNRPIDGRGRRQRATPGYPDLTAIRVGDDLIEILWVELKRDTTYPSPAQREWLEALGAAAQAVTAAVAAARQVDPALVVVDMDAVVWRPRDWDLIQTRVARGRRVVPASFDPRG